jgi:HSP20 family protein
VKEEFMVAVTLNASNASKPFIERMKPMNTLIKSSSLFDDFLRDVAPAFYVRPLHGDPLPTPAQIKVDVKETDDCYTVYAEIPGVPKEDIQVTIDGSMVSLRAEVKQQDSSTKDDKVLRSERYFGAVSRSFQLPVDIDQAQAKAKFDNGVLTLTLPKKMTMNTSQRLMIE